MSFDPITFGAVNQLRLRSSRGPGIVNRILESGSWVAPVKCRIRLHQFGGGGSGASVAPPTSGAPYNIQLAQGGAAGGYAITTLELNAGDVLSIVVGSGGAAVQATSTGTGVNGNDGGDTTVTVNGRTIIAGGGLGGKFEVIPKVASSQTTTMAGVTSRPTTGGDLNLSSGTVGAINMIGSNTSAIANLTFATPAGAVSYFYRPINTPNPGINIGGGLNHAAGCGVGGVGTYNNGNLECGGGGSGGDASGSTPGRALDGTTSYVGFVPGSGPLPATGPGGNFSYPGGGATCNPSSANSPGGLLAGGASSSITSASSLASAGGLFGGGGGADIRAATTTFSGAGGNGGVVIEILDIF